MVRIISFLNEKGGVGKTTSLINVGAALAQRHRKVLLIDSDATLGMTRILNGRESEITLYELMWSASGKAEPLTKDLVKSSIRHHNGYDFIPGSRDLAGLDMEFAALPSREFLIADILELIKSEYDYILIDCPGAFSLLPLNSLVASTEVMIVFQTEALSVEIGIDDVEVLSKVQKRLNPNLTLTGVIPTIYDKRKSGHRDCLEYLKEIFGGLVFTTVVRDNAAVSDATGNKMDIFEWVHVNEDMDKESMLKYSKFYGVTDYTNLANEIIEQENKINGR